MTMIDPQPQQRRIQRRPSHTFNLSSRPWQIVPCMIAPVLPGETLVNLLLQSRVVTDPIADPLIGWWKEYYFFYVQFDDLDNATAMKDMMLDVDSGPGIAQASAHNRSFYSALGTQKYVEECYQVIVRHYFRDADEDETTGVASTYCDARVDYDGVHQSILGASHMPTEDLDPGTDLAPAEDIQLLMRQWEVMAQMGLAPMRFEDYLEAAGVRGPQTKDPTKPELIRYVRDWQYPSNTIEPSTGAPSSAVSWSIAERADKKRFFTQPGFVFGVTVTRPKVYFGHQEGAASQLLDRMQDWMPPWLRGQGFSTLKEYADNTGLYDASQEGYWLDTRDLFIYGDQFLNYDPAPAANGGPRVALPSTSDIDNVKYPSTTDMDNCFTSASAKRIREDGRVQLNVASWDAKDLT